MSKLLTLNIIWTNNRLLFYPFIIFLVLLILWYFVGRDKKGPVVVQYKPPKDITPAEAGYLWDNKLKKRDLVSLIYYWAGNGILSIKEIKSAGLAGNDYELTKFNALPHDAKNFEQTIFRGLFVEDKTTVKISSLKNTFYYIMNKAHIKHPVGFIQHHELDAVQLAGAALHVVKQPSGRGHQHIDAVAQGVHLPAIANATEHDGRAQVGKAGEIVDGGFDLGGQLAGWFED